MFEIDVEFLNGSVLEIFPFASDDWLLNFMIILHILKLFSVFFLVAESVFCVCFRLAKIVPRSVLYDSF